MNYASPVSASPASWLPLAGNQKPLERSLLTKAEVLKETLDNFTVTDEHGEVIGEIRNLVLYRRRLHLVIVQPDAHCHWRFVLLSSHLVQRINLSDRTVLVHTTYADVSYLPAQRSAATRARLRHAASAQASVLAPVSQLPALVLPDGTHPAETAEPSRVLLEPIALKPHSKVKVPLVMESAAMPKAIADQIEASSERSPQRRQEMNDHHHDRAYPVLLPARPVTGRSQ